MNTPTRSPRTPSTVRDWRSREAARVARIYPRICLETCAGCQGRGEYTIATREYVCRMCNGRGHVVCENA